VTWYQGQGYGISKGKWLWKYFISPGHIPLALGKEFFLSQSPQSPQYLILCKGLFTPNTGFFILSTGPLISSKGVFILSMGVFNSKHTWNQKLEIGCEWA